MSDIIPGPEWVKCLVCKTSGPLHDGATFEKGIAKCGNKCPYCKEVGLIRDKRAEARAKKAKTEEAEKTKLDEFMYPVPSHVFHEGPGCPHCGGHEGTVNTGRFLSGLTWSNSVVVQCDCSHLYTWPCVDIRALDQPGEDRPLSPCNEEARLRELRDDQLREVFE